MRVFDRKTMRGARALLERLKAVEITSVPQADGVVRILAESDHGLAAIYRARLRNDPRAVEGLTVPFAIDVAGHRDGRRGK